MTHGVRKTNARAGRKASRSTPDFTPALPILWAYDPIIALLTRDRLWRSALLRQLNPSADDVIADIGCGTGSLLAKLGATAPAPRLIGIDAGWGGEPSTASRVDID